MGNIERWTIYPSRWFGEGRDRSLALGRVEPRPATDSEPFEVVRADAYLGAVEALELLCTPILGDTEDEVMAETDRRWKIALATLDRLKGASSYGRD